MSHDEFDREPRPTPIVYHTQYLTMKTRLSLVCVASAASVLSAQPINILFLANSNDSAFESFATSGSFAGSTWTHKSSSGFAGDLATGFAGFDLVIVGVPNTSSAYIDGSNGALWAASSAPVLVTSVLAARSVDGRMGLFDGAASVNIPIQTNETVIVSNSARADAILTGVGNPSNLFGRTTMDTINSSIPYGEGEVIAHVLGNTSTNHSLVYWDAGSTTAIGNTLVSDAAYFNMKGSFNLDFTADGQIVLGNLIRELTTDSLSAIPEPAALGFFAGMIGCAVAGLRRRRRA